MPNFIDCWTALKSKGYKHADGSEVLGDADKASIMARIQEHLKTGVDPVEAAKLSVRSHLEEAHGQLEAIYDQFRPKEAPPPEAPPTEPAPVAVEGGDTTGIAQRVHEQRAPGAIEPGEGVSPEEMVQRGRELLKGGADPEAILEGVAQGKAVTGDEIATLRAKHEEMSRVTNQAEDAMRANPNDPAAKQAYENAFKAETNFAQRIKPAQTEWHKAGAAMQGEVDIDTGSFSGLRRAFVESSGRDVTPKETVKLEKTAQNVKRVTSNLEKAKKSFSDLVGKETKGRAPVTLENLRQRFADRIRTLTPC